MEEHTDGEDTILPTTLPERRGGKKFLFLAALATVAALGLMKFGGNSPASAEEHAPAEQVDLLTQIDTAIASDMLRVEVDQVKPTGIDNRACARLPYDRTATCNNGERGQKFAKVDGRYVRITCGDCIQFTYPKDRATTVRFVDTTKEGGAQ